MKIFWGKSYFTALAVVAAFLSLIQSIALVSAELPPSPPFSNAVTAPTCLKTLTDCVKRRLNFTNINIDDASNPDAVCCPEWTQIVEKDRKCFCDVYGSEITSTTSPTSTSLKNCNIDASADTLCPGGSKATPSHSAGKGIASSTKWIGLLSGLLLLAGVRVY